MSLRSFPLHAKQAILVSLFTGSICVLSCSKRPVEPDETQGATGLYSVSNLHITQLYGKDSLTVVIPTSSNGFKTDLEISRVSNQTVRLHLISNMFPSELYPDVEVQIQTRPSKGTEIWRKALLKNGMDIGFIVSTAQQKEIGQCRLQAANEVFVFQR